LCLSISMWLIIKVSRSIGWCLCTIQTWSVWLTLASSCSLLFWYRFDVKSMRYQLKTGWSAISIPVYNAQWLKWLSVFKLRHMIEVTSISCRLWVWLAPFRGLRREVSGVRSWPMRLCAMQRAVHYCGAAPSDHRWVLTSSIYIRLSSASVLQSPLMQTHSRFVLQHFLFICIEYYGRTWSYNYNELFLGSVLIPDNIHCFAIAQVDLANLPFPGANTIIQSVRSNACCHRGQE